MGTSRLWLVRRSMVPLAGLAALASLGWGQEGSRASHEAASFLTHSAYAVVFGGAAGLWAFGDEQDRQTVRRCADGLLASTAVVETLRSLTKSPRPRNHEERTGFPSGHAAMAFCAATILAERDHRTVPWGYVWAMGVTWSRVELDAHTWWQALAGAGIGWLIGRESAHGAGMFGHWIVPQDEGPGASFLSPAAEAPVLSLELAHWAW